MTLKEVGQVSLIAIVALVIAWNFPATKQIVFNQ